VIRVVMYSTAQPLKALGVYSTLITFTVQTSVVGKGQVSDFKSGDLISTSVSARVVCYHTVLMKCAYFGIICCNLL